MGRKESLTECMAGVIVCRVRLCREKPRNRRPESEKREKKRESSTRGEKSAIRQKQNEVYSILKQEIPIDRDLGALLRTPAKSKHALASLFASNLGYTTADVPHPEGDASRSVDDHFVLINKRAAILVPLLAPVRVCFGDVEVRVAQVGVREWFLGAFGDRDDGGSTRLGKADVLHDAVCESGRKRHFLATR